MARYNDVLVLALLALYFAAALAQVDRTLDDGATGKDVVIATVDRIRESGIFPDDHQFLRRMALVESNYGETVTSGGIWRITRSNAWIKLQNSFSSNSISRGNRVAQRLQAEVQAAFNITWTKTFPTVQDLSKPLYSALAVMLYIQVQRKTIPDNATEQAELWKSLFSTGATSLTIEDFEEAADDVEEEDCDIKGVDMVFVMDASGSIGSDNFELMKQLAINITNEFEIGPDRTQVGWITFDHQAEVAIDLTTYHDSASLHQAILNITFTDGGTNIGNALLELYNNGFTSARSDLDVPHVAIVVTDGQSSIGPIQMAAALIKEQGRVDVYAVGIGGYDDNQLLAVAKAGIARKPEENVFTLPNFETEGLQKLQESLRARACFSGRFIEATIEDLKGLNSTVPMDVTSYINTECPPEGLTINVCGKEGKIILYISKTTQTPSSAMYDEIIEVEKNKCSDAYVECTTDRRKRQTGSSDRIFIGIEGVEETNEYELNANLGDTSTPKVKLRCQRSVALEPQSVIVTCTSERELTSILCSINNGPFQNCIFPWVVDVVSLGATEYYLQINVTDSLNLTDTEVIEYTVKPLILGCWLSDGMSVDCQGNNQLDLQSTKCRLPGGDPEPCTLPYLVELKGLPAAIYEVQIEATDVFGLTDRSTVEYQLVEDRVSDDMVMSVPLDIDPPLLGLTANTLSLCYQIHGKAGKHFNLLSDRCVSVNAYIVQPHSDIDSNVMDQIGVRAVGSNGSCYNIQIDRHDCSAHINGQQLLVNVFEEEDIVVNQYAASIARPQSIQITAPNCDGGSIDMFISCTYYDIQNVATEILQFGSTRGEALAEPPHGQIGQFWGVFLTVQPYTGLPGQPPPSSDLYEVSIFHPDDTKARDFVATLVPRIWGSRQTPCLYAGDKQGGRTGSIIGGPRGTVIQGQYMDYEVEGLFDTQFSYSKFDETKC